MHIFTISIPTKKAHSQINSRSALIRNVTQRAVAIPSSSSSFLSCLDSWPLKMGPIGCPETSVRNCHFTLRDSPEQRRSHLFRGGSLKSHTIQFIHVLKYCYMFRHRSAILREKCYVYHLFLLVTPCVWKLGAETRRSILPLIYESYLVMCVFWWIY